MIAIEAVTTTGATAALCQSVGLARATLYRRRQPARSSTPTPRAASSRALGLAERQAVLDVLHSERFVDQSPAEVQATLLAGTDVSLLHAHDVSHSRRRGGSPGAARPGAASGVRETGARGDGPESDLVVGYHEAERADPLPVLLAVCDPGSLQSLRRGLDGRRARERPPGPAPDRGDVPQATHRSAATHDPRGPRRA